MLRKLAGYYCGFDLIRRTDQRNQLVPTSRAGIAVRYVSSLLPRYVPIVIEVSAAVCVARGDVATGLDWLAFAEGFRVVEWHRRR
tara:strand:- start:3312 stop:3566 length:255 start_codon:yes stop_codon:yes gene_type:complete